MLKVVAVRLLVCIFITLSLSAYAKTRWEVAVVFLSAKENLDYQKDIDHNILELSRANPNDYFHLSIYREFEGRSVQYFVNPQAKPISKWDPLFQFRPPVSLKIPGVVIEKRRTPKSRSLIQDPHSLKAFFGDAYRNPNSKRILILYSHGAAFEGLGNGIPLKEVEENLKVALPNRAKSPLDILWMDACFMANIETVYQLSELAPIYVASEEAEFSSAEPFDMLKFLTTGPDDPRKVALYLAERFIESYSYIKKGSQRKNVLSSSATISVIETAKLDYLVEPLIRLSAGIGKLNELQRTEISTLLPHLTMERQDVFDLGSFLIHLSRSQHFSASNIQTPINDLRNILDLGRPERFRTNPRLMVSAPATMTEAPMVYGYHDWTRGYRGDHETLKKLPEVLREEIDFLPGLYSKEWPAKVVSSQFPFYFSPFSVDLNRFHYYFSAPDNSKLLSKISTYDRTQDFVFLRSKNESNPILLSAYTQGVGDKAERYLGLSILDPTNGVTSMDYVDLDFSYRTAWGNLY